MTASKSLPARPSLESLRKQAKKLARDVAAGEADAIARARAHLPNADLPLTQRNAQLVIAREYGYAGWQDLTAEVSRRVGRGVEWAAKQARRAIHDNDVDRLKQLLADYPELLAWQGDDNHAGLLGFATGAYGDAGTEERERWFTRRASAEALLDAGALVTPSVCEGLIQSRARGLLRLFDGKGVLPRTLKFLAALGDLDAVRASLNHGDNDLASVNDAFMVACSFGHESIASLLLDRAIGLDPEFGKKIDRSVGRSGFVSEFIAGPSLIFMHATPMGPWQAFAMKRVLRAADDRDLSAFSAALRNEPWLLGEEHVGFQVGLIEHAAVTDHANLITALLDLNPALLRRQPPPPAQAIEYAMTYGHTHLIPALTAVWPLPDDLAHAAGMGDLARVRQWFDASGAPVLGDVRRHFPHSGVHQEANDPWDAAPAQKVLDTALAWSVINHHFEIADFLLEHGADIDTTWNSHEPASILHHLVFYGTYESMRFLIDHGIDMTIKDYRWNATAQGWARYGARDEKIAQWLDEAERERDLKR